LEKEAGKSPGFEIEKAGEVGVAGQPLIFLSACLPQASNESFRDLPALLFGESMGGTTAMLMYFQSEPNMWSGLIFSAPLSVMPENMKPSKVRLLVGWPRLSQMIILIFFFLND
jgi:alpha-beta hydrolase superfamily lysophospholipase